MTSLKSRMTQGNIVSWATGIFLGLVLGIALLIVTNAGAPKGGSAEAAAEAGATQTTTAESTATAAQSGNTPETAGTTSTAEAATSGGAASDATASDAASTDAASSGAASTDTAAAGAGAAGDAAAGGEKFAGTCGGCHGAQGQGGMGPAMTANAKNWDLAGFTAALREGKTPDGRTLAPMMPHFTADQVSDGDIANIHAWVQSL